MIRRGGKNMKSKRKGPVLNSDSLSFFLYDWESAGKKHR